MKIIRPLSITDTRLADSNVPETDYAEFSMGTTYAEGDTIIDSIGVEILTLDVAPATSWVAGDFITGQTSTKTAYVVAQLTSLTYRIRERTGSFTLGEIIGVTGTPAKLADQGAAFPTVTAAIDKIHKIYESLTAANLANYPPSDVLLATPKWLEISSTNRWKAFDAVVGSQTSQATSITYEITAAEIFDSIAFLNLDASEVNLVFTDPIHGEVYNETISLITTAITGTTAVIDWYTYFFGAFMKITDFVRLDIPPYLNAVLTITINNSPGVDAKVGAIIIGRQTIIGTTLAKPSVGIIDYSVKTVNAFGHYTITERSYSKRMHVDLKIFNSSIDDVLNILAYYRAAPLVWVASEGFSSLLIYGFYKEFTAVIDYNTYSLYSLEIEGLI